MILYPALICTYIHTYNILRTPYYFVQCVAHSENAAGAEQLKMAPGDMVGRRTLYRGRPDSGPCHRAARTGTNLALAQRLSRPCLGRYLPILAVLLRQGTISWCHDRKLPGTHLHTYLLR